MEKWETGIRNAFKLALPYLHVDNPILTLSYSHMLRIPL